MDTNLLAHSISECNTKVKIVKNINFLVTFQILPIHLLHREGTSAKMPVLWHFVCINDYNSHQVMEKEYELWCKCEL